MVLMVRDCFIILKILLPHWMCSGKHHIVDRHIYYAILDIHIPLIRQHIGSLDVIVII